MERLSMIFEIALRFLFGLFCLPFGAFNAYRCIVEDKAPGAICFAIIVILGLIFAIGAFVEIINLYKQK